MGLNIGIYVKKQSEGYMQDGRNPKGTEKEIEERFFKFLNDKFPEGGFGHGWVNAHGKEYDFDIRIFSYGNEIREHGYNQNDFYLAIVEFIFNEFSHIEGIEMRTYWSG